MPKIVDHDQRRLELLEAVWRIIARDGLDAATMRSISTETGWSSGVLQHYFASKRDIILSAHRYAYARVGARIAKRTGHLHGIEALRVALDEALPLDDERLIEARVEVGAWAMAMNDPEFLSVRRESLAVWQEYLAATIREARELGQIRSREPDDLLSHRIVSLVDAMSVEAVLFPELASADRQRELAATLIQSIQLP